MNIEIIEKINWYGDECIGFACDDLKSDFERSAECSPKTENKLADEEKAVNVFTLETAEGRKIAEKYFEKLPSANEECAVNILSDRIIIVGTDKRAAMWGIYGISKRLGIPECIAFTETPIKKKLVLKNDIFYVKPETYKFRGWFINDEDLLSKWHISGGKRNMDYKYYDHITAVESLKPVVETALRLGINLIIPGSFIDIDDPWQEKLVAYCVSRGMYVSQHHLEPLGVSHFTYKSYYEKQGIEPEFSFVTKPEKAEEIWKYYAKKWAKYGKNVIWQLGLRGKADRPVWYNDSAENSRAQWGGIISAAVQKQYDIISEEVGEDFISTSTLWMEGAALYNEGFLEFPERTILVFADAGPTQMMSSDFYNTVRRERKYGIYYHVAYFGDGPHLAMGTNPEKILFNYKKAVDFGDTEYSILNVSNVRELIMTVTAASKIVWNINDFDISDFYEKWCDIYFGNSKIAELIPEYFEAFPVADKDDLNIRYGKYFDFYYCDTPFPYYVANDGLIRLIAIDGLQHRYEQKWEERLKESKKRFEMLKEKAKKYSADNYFSWFAFQVQYLLYLVTWAEACCKFAQNGEVECLIPGIKALEQYLEERKEFEKGIFENWYRGDDKFEFPYMLEVTKKRFNNDESKIIY